MLCCSTEPAWYPASSCLSQGESAGIAQVRGMKLSLMCRNKFSTVIFPSLPFLPSKRNQQAAGLQLATAVLSCQEWFSYRLRIAGSAFRFVKSRGASILHEHKHRLPSLTLCREMILLYLERGKAQMLHQFWACYMHSSFGSPMQLSQASSCVGLFLQKAKASGMTVKTWQSFACRKMCGVAATHRLNAMQNSS